MSGRERNGNDGDSTVSRKREIGDGDSDGEISAGDGQNVASRSIAQSIASANIPLGGDSSGGSKSTPSRDQSSYRNGNSSNSSWKNDILIEGNKSLFLRAYEYLRMGNRPFRWLISICAKRKLFLLGICNLVAMFVIWAHFTLTKLEEQKFKVEEDSPFYWFDLLVPSLEYGAIHVILYLMAVIPLTMVRYSIANLAESFVEWFIPLNQTLAIHEHLGYMISGVTLGAGKVVIMVNGWGCYNGEEAFCYRLFSETALVGYACMAVVGLIMITSWLRRFLPYELFSFVHHFSFLLYAYPVVFAFDAVQNDSLNFHTRTLVWFCSTIAFYLVDRLVMRLNCTYKARIVSASAVEAMNGSQMLQLKIRRPILFTFKPGQYAYLRLSDIDGSWHPFSIASAPSSRYLEFYIQIQGGRKSKTWTRKLWNFLQNEGSRDTSGIIDFDVMGPAGSSFGKMNQYSHGLLVGAGTGIVPLLSMFKEHIHCLLRSDHFAGLEERQGRRADLFHVFESRSKGCFASQLFKAWKPRADPTTKVDGSYRGSNKTLRKTSRQLQRAALREYLGMIGWLVLVSMIVFGVLLIGISISWNTISVIVHGEMIFALKIATLVFQIAFAIPSMFIFDSGASLIGFADFVSILACIPADMTFFSEYENSNGQLSDVHLIAFVLLTSYQVARLWFQAVELNRTPKIGNEQGHTMDRLELVWIVPSAPLVATMIQDLERLLEEVVNKYTLEAALKACRINIYCTDTDESAAMNLRNEVSDLLLYQRGMLSFGAPEMAEIIENQSLEIINDAGASSTLLAFSGRSKLSQSIGQIKCMHQLALNVTGNERHRIDYVYQTHQDHRRKVKKRGVHSSGKTSESSSGGTNGSNSRNSGDDEESAQGKSVKHINFAAHRQDQDTSDLMSILSKSRAQTQ